MGNLETALQGAAEDGIITKGQAETLLSYLGQRLTAAEPTAGGERGLAARREDVANPLEDSEAPRFVRGFHDILITIGIVVLLAGLRGLTPIYVELPVIIALAEVLVRRQRLALPAVVLTIALAHWIETVAVAVAVHRLAYLSGINPFAIVVFIILPFPPLLVLFYWRYRIPLSFAILIVSIFALLVAGIFYLIHVPLLIDGVRDPLNPADGSPLLSLCVLFVAALAMFAVAMYFDLKDLQRVTRRSDIAFWLHLATAPALLYATILLVSWLEIRGFGSGLLQLGFNIVTYAQAMIIVSIVLVLMLVGVIIDRRAFVTSGLLSLGAAVVSILQLGHAQFSTAGFAALLIVGVFVLVIGVGWPHLRRAIVGWLPLRLQTKLPALR